VLLALLPKAVRATVFASDPIRGAADDGAGQTAPPSADQLSPGAVVCGLAPRTEAAAKLYARVTLLIWRICGGGSSERGPSRIRGAGGSDAMTAGSLKCGRPVPEAFSRTGKKKRSRRWRS
jgi:hypothetical protein